MYPERMATNPDELRAGAKTSMARESTVTFSIEATASFLRTGICPRVPLMQWVHLPFGPWKGHLTTPSSSSESDSDDSTQLGHFMFGPCVHRENADSASPFPFSSAEVETQSGHLIDGGCLQEEGGGAADFPFFFFFFFFFFPLSFPPPFFPPMQLMHTVPGPWLHLLSPPAPLSMHRRQVAPSPWLHRISPVASPDAQWMHVNCGPCLHCDAAALLLSPTHTIDPCRIPIPDTGLASPVSTSLASFFWLV